MSLLTGGLNIWKVAKDVFIILLTLFFVIVVWLKFQPSRTYRSLFIIAVSYGAIHLVTWLINPNIDSQTAILGTVYNNRLIWLILIGAPAAVINKGAIEREKLIKFILIISSIVSLLAIFQYFLPKDLLTHLGYSIERGVKPNFFIDDKPDLPRVMSTLRDPNSLGAYLVIPISLLVAIYNRHKNKLLIGGLLIMHLLALFLTFSRGAWLGVFIALSSLAWMINSKTIIRNKNKIAVASLGIMIVIFSVFLSFRNQYAVQNIVLHSDSKTVAAEDSNDLHLKFIREGVKDIVKKPFGHGPGTAGIVSIHNDKGGRLTENYYIQIGYEVGIIGLAIFLSLLILVYREINNNKDNLSRALLSGLIAYSSMALIMHIWSNEAVATQWWLLAGIAIGLKTKKSIKT